MVTPYRITWVSLKNTDPVGGGERLTFATHKHRILINGVSWAVAAFEFGRHIAEAEFTHIEVGAIEPVRVGVLVRHKHFRHGDFIRDRAECFVFNIPHAIKNRALPGIEPQVELPVLPVNFTARDGEISCLLYTSPSPRDCQ